jgi:hypothetical protein
MGGKHLITAGMFDEIPESPKGIPSPPSILNNDLKEMQGDHF